MPNPSGTFDPFALPPALGGRPTAVLRYAEGQFELLPTVRWVRITHGKGPVPSRATFRQAYRVDADALAAPAAPFERVLPLAGVAPDPGTVRIDDRLVVATLDDDGGLQFLFDGFVQMPEAAVDGRSYRVVFQAQGTPIRCWDTPLNGSWRRDASAPGDPARTTWCSGLPARLNPDGRPNATGDPLGDGSWDYAWSADPPQRAPVFFDPLYPPDRTDLWPGGPYVRAWTLGMAARYVLAAGNADQTWVENPDFPQIDNQLRALPADPDGDSGAGGPIVCRDALISGKPWPEVLHGLLAPHGLTFSFQLGTRDGLPFHALRFERERDGQGAAVKSLFLQPAGTPLDPGRSNTRALELAVDASQIVNAYHVARKADEYEVGIVLAPGFQIDPADPANPTAFLSSNPDRAADRDRYRLFVADECGEGHWRLTAGSLQTGRPFDFSRLWGASWVVRRRPGYGDCFSLDPRKLRRPPQLSILTNWGRPGMADPPCLFDPDLGPNGGSPGSPPIIVPVKGPWQLLHDRLGVRLTTSDPTRWNIGTIASTHPAADRLNGGTIDLVANYASFQPDRPDQHLFLLLTCVIESDRVSDPGYAGRTAGSATRFAVSRQIDGRDRYRRWAVHRSSGYQQGNSSLYGTDTDDPRARYLARDDAPTALGYAQALRSATQEPSMAGRVTLGRLTDHYRVGDRIDQLVGRMSLQTSVNDPGRTAPARFPMVVELTWHNEPEQTTTLLLDDDRALAGPVED